MNDLFVAAGARGGGLADALIAECVERCRARGATSLGWQTAKDNHRAQAVYERVGGKREEWLDYSIDVARERPSPTSRRRYSACSSVSASISTPSDAELQPRDLVVDRRPAPGGRRGSSPPPSAPGTPRPAPAWRSSCPSPRRDGPAPAARFTTRPAASRFSRRPPRSYSSTSGRTSHAVGRSAQRVEVDLDVEVARVGQHGAVLHALEVLGAQHAARAGDRDEQVPAPAASSAGITS